MQTKWQHLTPDECAANKSIYAKHLLIIIIRYAAHTRAYLQSTQPHTHTHTQSTFNPNLHLCAHGNCLVYGGQTAITCRALCVFSSAKGNKSNSQKKCSPQSHTHTWTWTYTPIRACGTNTHRATYKLTLIKRD